MSEIEGMKVVVFVWEICKRLAELDVTEAEPGRDYSKEELQDRYSVALLTNSSLFTFIYYEIPLSLVVDFIENTINAFGHIPCGSVKYIEALLANGGLCKMVVGSTGVVVKG